MDPKYTAWLASIHDQLKDDLAKARSQEARVEVVREAANDMWSEYPELKIVHGICEHWLDGRREHWWLVTPDGQVVDPCQAFWNSGGTGQYVASGSLTIAQLAARLDHGYRLTGVHHDGKGRTVILDGVPLKDADRRKHEVDNARTYLLTVIELAVP